MFAKRLLCLLLVLGTMLCVVSAAEVDSNSIYCFSAEDFALESDLQGICITGLPDPQTGTVMLGSRVLQCGDILTAAQIGSMTFHPLHSQEDAQATVTYLPIYENRVAPAASMCISIRAKVNQAPVAQDQALETYKNLANSAPLKAHDPEGQALTYTVTRQPRRGSVQIGTDGSFTYTPKKNKVGTDSFCYTVTDPAGNVSREATVTVRILKPGDAAQYSDTAGTDCAFEAEWLKNTGLFTGSQVGENLIFSPDSPMSRGEFLAICVQLLGIPVEENVTTSVYTDEIPAWLQPYLAAALRSGMTAGLPADESGAFGAEVSVCVHEAAVLLQNALDLSVSAAALEQVDADTPQWAVAAVAALQENGVNLGSGSLSRAEVAKLLYQISALMQNAPGLQLYQ